jgi:hypothetical protein
VSQRNQTMTNLHYPAACLTRQYLTHLRHPLTDAL